VYKAAIFQDRGPGADLENLAA